MNETPGWVSSAAGLEERETVGNMRGGPPEDIHGSARSAQQSFEAAGPMPKRVSPEAESEEYALPDSPLERLRESLGSNWRYAAAGAAVLFVLVVALKLLGAVGGGEAGRSGQNPPDGTGQAGGGQALELAAPLSVRDTGIVFEAPAEEDSTSAEEDSTYYLKAGEIAWKGELENTGTGEMLTLEGPTAAQFKRAVALPQGSIMTGVFGRAEPEKPIVHATFQRVDLGGDEQTSGTYYAVDGGRVLVKGSYFDQRDGEAITRTYVEDADPATHPGLDARYAVRFEAPPDTPIPALVGWRPPEEAEGGEGQ